MPQLVWPTIEALHRDFRCADLKQLTLSGFKLDGFNFRGADLRSANLTETDLTGATFCGADLFGTDLTGAILFRTDFRGAHGLTPEQRADFNKRGAIVDE